MIFIFVLLFAFGLSSPPKMSDQKLYDNMSEPFKDFLDDITVDFFSNRKEKVRTQVLQIEEEISKLKEKNSVLIAENVLLKDKVKKSESAFMPKTFIGWSMLTLSLIGIFFIVRMYYTLYIS